MTWEEIREREWKARSLFRTNREKLIDYKRSPEHEEYIKMEDEENERLDDAIKEALLFLSLSKEERKSLIKELYQDKLATDQRNVLTDLGLEINACR